MPTDVSSALETTTGRPQACATSSAGATPAQRRDLEHDDVGGAGEGHPQRVLGLADALVGRDRHVDAGPGQGPPERGEPVEVGARLLGVLEVVRRQRRQRGDRLLDRPGAVGVDPHPARRAEHLADGGDAVDVVGAAPGRPAPP